MNCKHVLVLAAALILTSTAFANTQPKDIISKERAIEIATKTSPGVVQSTEIEFEKKQWVYSFDILGADKKIHEVLVNAKTGKVVETKIESAAQEAKEAEEEK